MSGRAPPADDDSDKEEAKPKRKAPQAESDEEVSNAPKKAKRGGSDDEAEEKPKKAKKDKSDDEEEKKPKKKEASRGKSDDEEEEKPKKKKEVARGKSDDEEEEKPKKKKEVARGKSDDEEEEKKPDKKAKKDTSRDKSDDEEEKKPDKKKKDTSRDKSDEEEEEKKPDKKVAKKKDTSRDKSDDEEAEKKPAAKKKKDQEEASDEEETAKAKPKKKAEVFLVPSSLSAAELKKELEKRHLPSSGAKAVLIARLSDALAEEGKLDPQHMNVAQLRTECEKLGLDATASKAIMMHAVMVERARLAGGDTEVFDPQLMTVAQLKKWLKGHGVAFDNNGSKSQLAKLVASTVEEEESDKKENDVSVMTIDQMVAWLTERGVKINKKKGDSEGREYYEELVQSHVGKGGVLLFSEEDILFQKKLFFGQRLIVVKGDITKCKANAIVCPTNEKLALDGGVGKALLKICGPLFQAEIAKWVKSNPPLKTTKACLTAGHELNAANVIHTNSPQYKATSSKASIKELKDSISAIFEVADEEKLTNIALPSIGSGINGYPPEVAAKAILQAITDYFQDDDVSSAVREIYFVLFDDASVKVYTSTLTSL